MGWLGVIETEVLLLRLGFAAYERAETGHFTWMNTPQAADAIGTTSGARTSPPPSD